MSSNPEYQAEYREHNSEYVNRQNQLTRLRGRAQRILAQRHIVEYNRILQTLCDAEGIDPPNGP